MADLVTDFSRLARRPGSEPLATTLASDPSDAFSLDLSGFWQLLRKNWKVLAGTVLVTLLLAIVATLLVKPVYQAISVVRFEDDANQTIQIGSTSAMVASGNFNRAAKTQADLFKSRAMAETVYEAARLGRNPALLEALGAKRTDGQNAAVDRDQIKRLAIGYLQNGVAATAQPETELTQVSFDSVNPRLAAMIADAYTNAAVQMDLQHKFDSTTYARDFLTRQLELARQRLEQSEIAYNAYIARYGLLSVSGGGEGQAGSTTVVTNNLASSATTANQATNQRIAAEQIWQTAQSSAPLGVPQVQADPQVQQLRGQLAAARAKLAQDRVTYGNAHPAVITDQETVNNLNEGFKSAVGAVLNGLRTQYETARRQEEALIERVSGLKSDAENEERLGVRSNILKRDVDTNRSLYDALLQRQKEISAEAGVNKSNISIVDKAQVPSKPVSPNFLLNMAVGLVGGLFLGVIIVLLKSQLRQNLTMPTDFTEATGLPLLGVVPKMDPKVSVEEELDKPLSSLSEANFSIHTHLALARPEGLSGTLQVTSSRESEGKSTTAYSLARTMARMGSRTLLIDADLRRCRLHVLFGGVTNKLGLSQVLSNNAELGQVIQDTGIENLSLVTAGAIPPSPTELLAHSNFDTMLARAASQFDIVIVDGPPILGLADALLIASKVDGVIMIAESNRTPRAALRNALRRLATASPALLGIIVTKFNSDGAEDDYYYYNYNYAYKSETT